MSRRWWKSGKLKPDEEIVESGSTIRYEKNWMTKMLANGFGALCTAVVMVIFAITKFRDGAWVVLILIPALVVWFQSINRHYRKLAGRLSLDEFGGPAPQANRHRVIVPVSGVHQGSLEALRYARLLTDDVTAVHISMEPEETEKVKKKWENWGEGTRLVIVDSPYRLFLEPLLDYIEEIIAQRQPNETITIVVPEFVPPERWHNFLHMQTAKLLQSELLSKPGVVVTNVPYQVG